jgi:hypothetical protein
VRSPWERYETEFKKAINILKSEKITQEEHCFLDISEYKFAETVTGEGQDF